MEHESNPIELNADVADFNVEFVLLLLQLACLALVVTGSALQLGNARQQLLPAIIQQRCVIVCYTGQQLLNEEKT